MKLSFRNRVLVTILIACVICTGAAVLVARLRINRLGDDQLVDKSRAILSRLEVGREYIADMGIMGSLIEQTRTRYPDGDVPKEVKERILKSVPIFASFRLGQKRAEQEHYEFRIATTTPRNKENRATEHEVQWLKRFGEDPSLREIVEFDRAGGVLNVVRPVLLSEEQGCLTCHGSAAQSPWGNGKDILGYEMENMKDGTLKGAFIVRSSLAPVIESTNDATLYTLLWSSLITVLALVLGYLIMRSPLLRLMRVIDGVSSSASQVHSAAQQVSDSSQSMAEGASEQAASLEETSSTLEEMTATTRQNADHAQQAETLAGTARDYTQQGTQAMTRMSSAIANIRDASTKTAKIIKTIDEIAFQTNLLALNAAVEAARAGDAGKGFAVVAEEVRNLAQRSAVAARDTNELIEDAQQRAEAGVQASAEVEAVLGQIKDAIQQVADLVREVASASGEQARGAEQINAAVGQMDQVTQSNAANAEQSAASSEELSSQAMELSQMVADLQAVVQGGAAGGLGGARQALEGARTGQRAIPAPPRRRRNGNGRVRLDAQEAMSGPEHPAVSLRARVQQEGLRRANPLSPQASELHDAEFRDF
jgi:methyl-accepting chemotaxis protein